MPENPYAPPALEDPSVPEDSRHPWWVQGGDLLVHHNSKLPRVDLQSGKNDAELLPCTLVVVAMPSLTLSKSSAPRNTQIHCYVSREFALKQGKRPYSWIGLIVSRVGTAAMLTGIVIHQMQWILPIAVTTLLVSVAFSLRPRSTLASSPLRNGWIRFRRTPPAALAQLEALQRQPPLPAPGMVLVTSSRSYLQRYPLAMVVTRRWFDPVFAVQRLINRLTTPKDWEFEAIHPQHRMVCDLAALPPRRKEALDRWRKLQPEFSAWPTVEAFRIPSLSHFMLKERLQLHSPDGNHSVVVSLTTVTVSGVANETFSFHYATLLTDGMWIVTNTGRIIRNLTAAVQESYSGDQALAWKRHLAAIGSRPMAPATSVAEWIERRLALDELYQRGLEARGLADPPRVVQVPETLFTGA